MIKTEFIKVRYRKQDNSLSRPHKVKKVIYENGDITYTTMNQNRKINPGSFVTEWEETKKVPIHKAHVKSEDITDIIRVRFYNKKTGKLNRPVSIVRITKSEGQEVYTHLPIGCSKILDPKTFTTTWESGPTPVVSPKKLTTSRSFTSKDVSRLVKSGVVKDRTKAIELLNQYKTIRNVPGYSKKKQQIRGPIKNLGTSVNGKGLNLKDLTPKRISKTKPNLRKAFKANMSKKFTYFKQALGKKEITQIQFKTLVEHFIPNPDDRCLWMREGRDRERIRLVMKDEGTFVKLPLEARNSLSKE